MPLEAGFKPAHGNIVELPSHSGNQKQLNSVKLSKGMVTAEPWVIGASSLITPVGYLLGRATGNSSNRVLQPSFLTPASNILLSLFAAIGYQVSMPLAGIANYLYVVQELLRINPSTLQFGNTFFAFLPSAINALAWGADSDEKASGKITEKKNILGKLSAQIDFTKQYWTKEFPELFNISNVPKFMKEVKEKKLEALGKADKHFIMLHSMASFIATAFLILGMLANKIFGHNQQPIPENAQFAHKTIQANQNLKQSNIFNRVGWLIGQLGMAPLILFTLLNGFNGHINKKYGRFGRLMPYTAIAYGLTTLASVIFKPFAHIAIFTDFIKHLTSSTFGHLKRRGQLINSGA